jgi:ferredoxin
MAELEAAADTLVDDARRLGLGVAIVCSAAITEMPVGGPWLVLEVPSLEMVTAGWVLQVVAAGDRVTLVGCGEKACAGRGREMSLLSAEVVDQVAPGRRHLVVGPGDRLPACLGAAGAPGGAPRDQSGPPVRLHEPEATVQAISRLSDGPGSPWRLESPVAPLGEIAVDAARCSACACCVPACPTGAISAPSAPGGGAFVLTFDPSACPACGACVPSCPERAVSLRRAVSSATLASGRRTLVELARADRCPSCGKPRPGRHAAHVVAAKLAGSHPEIASRLQGEDRCADCLLTVRVEEVLGAEG